MKRLIAILIIIAPFFIATYGFTLIKDSFFNVGPLVKVSPIFQGFIGLVLFLSASIFIAGFIFRHDAKKKRINQYKKS